MINYLSKAQISRVGTLMPIYRWAVATVGGLTPIMLAALHYREAEFSKTAKLPGGPFQLDPGGPGSEREIQKLINDRVFKICQKYEIPYRNIDTDFNIAALVAAHILKAQAREGPLVVNGHGQIITLADAFWGYNGRSSFHTKDGKRDLKRRHWQFSPYVSNDPKRGVVLRIRGTVPLPKGMTLAAAIEKWGDKIDRERKRLRIDRPDPRPGALIIYRELKRRIYELEA